VKAPVVNAPVVIEPVTKVPVVVMPVVEPIIIESPVVMEEPPLPVVEPVVETQPPLPVIEPVVEAAVSELVPPPIGSSEPVPPQDAQPEWTTMQPIPDSSQSTFAVKVNMDKVKPIKTKMGGRSFHAPVTTLGVVPLNPFTEKPKIVTPTLNNAQLVQANPTLNDDYLQQRQVLLTSRQLQPQNATADDLKLADVKVDIPHAYLVQQKQMFDEQQAALRALRGLNQVVDETKIEKEVELAIPKQNDVPQRRVNINRARNVLPAHKQINELHQALPPANMVQLVESLRVDQLKQLCAQRGLAIKGNKPDLIARLKAAGIHNVTY